MAKVNKIRIETKFSNGAVSFRMTDDRLVKLGAGTIGDMINLIRPGVRVAGDMVSVFVRFWLDSAELIAGPDNVQKQQWDKEPRWAHRPYLWPSEFVDILGLLHSKDLSALSDFVRGCEWRNGLAYRVWLRDNMDVGAAYYGDRNMTATTVISPEEFEKMRAGK